MQLSYRSCGEALRLQGGEQADVAVLNRAMLLTKVNPRGSRQPWES